MNNNTADDTVVERLTQVASSVALPDAARDYVRHLVSRLSRPVRVSVLGKPKSGKSQLINLFVGQKLVPEDAELPTTEFAWGETACMTVTASDGSVAKVHSSDLATLSGRNAAFLRVELPVPILKRVNFLEVVTEGTAEELSAGVDWALGRTDISLWCTQAFGKMERAIWNRVEDNLKDHAFLVLTKADILSAEKTLSQRVAALETVVAEEFHSMFAVASLQAIQAHGPEGVNKEMLRASGGSALTSEVLRHADRGRRADLDSAHMFLARYQAPGKRTPSRKPTESQAEKAPPPPIEVVTPTQEPVSEPIPAVQPAPDTPVEVTNVELFSDAIRYLKRRGDGLAKSVSTLEGGDTKPLIDQCVDAVEYLTDLFSQDETGCEAVDDFIDDLAEASDVMVLMQVEDGDAPAADAVTLLLQLRHDMEMQLAA